MKTGAIYCGDCQHILGNTNEFPDECVDLIYVDPPFFSEKKYEVLWGDGYELRAFEDRWKGGIENYVAWMEPKVRECHRVLKKTGSMYLHCDWHANHRLRVLMDNIFGESNFKNEIICKRTSAHNDPKKFGVVHDAILFYTKSKNYTWNPQYSAYSDSYIDSEFEKAPDGRLYKCEDLTAPRRGGESRAFEWRGTKPSASREWRFGLEELERLFFEGQIKIGLNGKPRLRGHIVYLEDKRGTPLQSIWTDILHVGNTSNERLGYPTQKPEALLRRIIEASSNVTDVVLDPMCGCGTALAVAQKMDRRWVGIDVSPTACKLILNRMRRIGAQNMEIIGMPQTLEEVKGLQPFEFQNWVMQKMMGRMSPRKTGDMGIDGYLFDGTPIQVKQSEDVGRNVIDNFETAIKRGKKTKGIIVAFSFGKGAYEEVARAKNQDGVEIELKLVEEVIKEN